MTTRISQYLGGHIANWLRGTAMPTAPSVVYMALSTATISDVSGAVEPTGGYARQAVTYSAISRSEASGCIIANSAPIVFTGLDACVVTDFAIYDAATGGNVLVFGKLRAPFSVSAAGSVSFAVGVHTFQYAGLASYYFGDAICNWLKGTSTPPPTSVSLIHSTTPILRSGSGITAPAGGYSSKLVTFASPTFITDVGTSIVNVNNLIFGPATQAWTNITHAALLTDSFALIISGAVAVPFSVTPGDGRGVNTGAFKVTVR